MRPENKGAATDTGWRNVADELASALRITMLRNPTVNARDWDRAQAALGRYERAGGDPQVGTLPDQPPD